jgi:hypothetical protein
VYLSTLGNEYILYYEFRHAVDSHQRSHRLALPVLYNEQDVNIHVCVFIVTSLQKQQVKVASLD